MLFLIIRKKIDELMKDIASLRHDCMKIEKANEIEVLRAEVEKCWELEEKNWGQRSRTHWLKFGDVNSKFFHVVTVSRRQRNKVLKI